MGIKGLQSYLEKWCPSAASVVDITDLLNEHRRSTRDKDPIIVIDGQQCIRFLYRGLDWIGGGQFIQLLEKAQQFVNAFKDIGVHLVFFFDGPTEARKHKTCVERRKKSLESVYYVLDAISRGEKSYSIDERRHYLQPPGMGHICRLMFQTICGCEVYQSLTECDEEIAYYAKTHGAFAILTQDSDFVVLDVGEALYLSMEKLDLTRMKTVFYNSKALVHKLGIEFWQLPLLATFMGNDVIPYNELKSFHAYITDTKNGWIDFKQLVPKLVQYIRTLPRRKDLSCSELQKISQQIFGDPSRHEEILTSISSYNSITRRDFDAEDRASSKSTNWGDLLAIARNKHINNEIPGTIYVLMKGLLYKSRIMEDYRRDDLPAFGPVTLPIRKRMYGILLQEKVVEEGEELTVKEWCMAGPDSIDEPVLVTPECLSQSHPGLRALWSDNPKWNSLRWQLFVQSVSPDLHINALQSIPEYLVIPTMILFYFSKYLHSWEIDAMLATAACLKYYDFVKLRELPSDPLHPRGIRLSTLFSQTTYILFMLLAACGFPLSESETAPWKFFDGKLFQAKYIAAEEKTSHARLCENRDDVLKDFNMARQIILDQ